MPDIANARAGRKAKPHIRPSHELNNPMLKVSEGCSHGRCRFCGIYPDTPFTPLPLDEVAVGIDEIAKGATALTRRIYLISGNPLALPTKRLLKIFDLVRAKIPTVESFGGFCRISDIARKSIEELRELRACGVNEITIGAESGHDPTLKRMEKDHDLVSIVEQGQRLHEAGIDFVFFYLAGLAGKGKGQQNAIASARAFSAAGPFRILITTLYPTPSMPLKHDIAAGTWEPSGEVEAAEEIRTFIANLTCECNLNCSHDTDIIKFEGMIPKNQKMMLELLDHSIPKMNEAAASKIRGLILGGSWKAMP